ncbi:tetratricopeptide repeat protein [Kamptonema cortianum]|nr:tetratricopeptide repeat protein [Geitlerinema splendidum]MDK3162241.1 tetratricopeptide repeat protein [Kamptonema cortianum]
MTVSELENVIHSARNSFGERDFQKAVDSFYQATILAPDDYRGYEGLGLALISAGRPREAKEALLKAVELNPKDADVHFGLGLATEQMGDRSGAIEHIARAHELRPEHVPIRETLILMCVNYAELLMDEGNVEWAKKYIDVALEADHTSPDAAYAAIRYHARLGDYDEAKRILRFIEEHKPDSPGLLEVKEEIGLGKQKERGWLY